MKEPTVEVRLCGVLEVAVDGGDSIRLAPRPAHVLTLLALAGGATVTTETVIDALWGDDPPATARNSVQAFVSDLRRALGSSGREVIESTGGGYRLRHDLAATDVSAFERLLGEAAQAADPAERMALLSEALGLWRSDPLPELATEGPVQAAFVRLNDKRLNATEDLVALELDRNGSTDKLGRLQEIVAEHPYRERAVSLLARALYLEGRQTDALSVLSDLRRRLRDDLGLSPGRTIDAVESSILTQDPALEAATQGSDAGHGDQSVPPSGVVTLMFTDIEGSTQLWEDPERMQTALDRHDGIVRQEVTKAGGVVVKSEGDSFFVAFSSSVRAVTCAIAIERRLRLEEWETASPIAVRIGIHSGDLEPRHGDYLGPTVNLAARVMQAAHGGQILVSGVSADLVRPHTGADFSCRLLGRFELRGISDLVELHQVEAEGIGDRFPPLMVVRADLPLPSPASAFVGRSAEIDELRKAVLANRLVTIVGEGGLGKTRLAIEVARRLVADISSVGFADLAPRTGASAVVDEVCRSVGLGEISGDPVEALRMRLGSDPVLLVFDNCEHVIDAVRDLILALLETCPGLRVVATSRYPLNVSGERRYPLQPMAVESDAAELLNLRAQESGHIEPIPQQDSAALCQLLDGIPLAIELAASWLRVLEPSDLLARLKEDMSMMDASQSQRPSKAMTQTIEWSLGRLVDADAAAFEAICEFPAGITLDQAEHLLGPDAPLTLGRLIDSSLLRTTHAESGRRYRLLEPLRAIGLARVTTRGDSDAARRTQASVMLSLASAVGASLPTAHEPAWRTRLEDEVPNLVAAMSWATAADPSTAVEIVLPLAPLVSFVPASAARLAIPVAEEVDWQGVPGGLAAAALGLFAKAYLDADSSAAILASEIYEEVDRLDRAVDPSVLIHLATVRTVMNDPLGAIALFREASERGREVGEQVTVAEALMLEGAWQWFTQSEMNEAAIQECSRIAAQLGGPSLISLCEVVNGFSTMDDDPDRAEGHFRRALAVNAPTGYGPGVAEFMLALLHARRGSSAEALTEAQASLRRFMLAGLQIEVGMALGGLTGALLALGYDDSARFTAEVLAHHFPPIAAMRSFGQHIERAREASAGVVDVPVRRDEAITKTLGTIDELLTNLDTSQSGHR